MNLLDIMEYSVIDVLSIDIKKWLQENVLYNNTLEIFSYLDFQQ